MKGRRTEKNKGEGKGGRRQEGRKTGRKSPSVLLAGRALCWSGSPGKGRGHGIVCSTLKKLF